MLTLLNWVAIAISLFNTIELIWLGMTLLLNADRRAWGTWVAGGGFLLGALFFIGHSAVIGRELGTFNPEIDIWWRLSWLVVIGAPYLWYLVMLWYSGVLHTRRHRIWLAIVTLLGAGALALLAIDPLPSYNDIVLRAPLPIFVLAGIPVVTLIYPVYSILCISLSLVALRRPAASQRFMGDLARARARPWLFAASLVLLGVGLAVGIAMAWFMNLVRLGEPDTWFSRTLPLLLAFDSLISGLVAITIVLLGRAIVAYEIFTGKALPRGGLLRYWRSSLILAIGYGLLIGASLNIPLHPIDRLLLATALLALFFALLSWRSYTERERSIDALRPFVASQRLYERLLEPITPPEIDVAAPLRALCDDILGARLAHLIALGPLAPLVAPITVGTTTPTLPPITDLIPHLRSPHTMCIPLDRTRYADAVWAVPLWGERGLIGTLLLGEKRDGGLYTQEEIEIARAAAERLIDTQAGAELSRRLMALQRRRLAESQVLDRHARRVLHDDVLPRLHTAMLMLGAAAITQPDHHPSPTDTQRSESLALLTDLHHQIANLLHAIPTTTTPDITRLGLIGTLRRALDDELNGAFETIRWQLAPDTETIARTIPPLAAEVIFYAAREAIRNAARYGRGGDSTRALHLLITTTTTEHLEIAIEDDGIGIGAIGTTNGGSGQGLRLHSTMMAVIGGTLTLESIPERATRVTLTLPRAIWEHHLLDQP